ncbi:hypothetical protein AB0N07_44125, partial [Streptomyces sp. NPDC051172]|uniref:scabin-related ADP-ribosyltransferase n=1 Tax=Streptomyces sp. NPDC051172 TaxID=3155796 RepID=UPI0034217B9A
MLINFGDLLFEKLSSMIGSLGGLSWTGSAWQAMKDASVSVSDAVKQVCEEIWHTGEMINYYALERTREEISQTKDWWKGLVEAIVGFVLGVLSFALPALLATLGAAMAAIGGVLETIGNAVEALGTMASNALKFVSYADSSASAWAKIGQFGVDALIFSAEGFGINAASVAAGNAAVGLPTSLQELIPVPTSLEEVPGFIANTLLWGGLGAVAGMAVKGAADSLKAKFDAKKVNVNVNTADLQVSTGAATGKGTGTGLTLPSSVTSVDAALVDSSKGFNKSDLTLSSEAQVNSATITTAGTGGASKVTSTAPRTTAAAEPATTVRTGGDAPAVSNKVTPVDAGVSPGGSSAVKAATDGAQPVQSAPKSDAVGTNPNATTSGVGDNSSGSSSAVLKDVSGGLSGVAKTAQQAVQKPTDSSAVGQQAGASGASGAAESVGASGAVRGVRTNLEAQPTTAAPHETVPQTPTPSQTSGAGDHTTHAADSAASTAAKTIDTGLRQTQNALRTADDGSRPATPATPESASARSTVDSARSATPATSARSSVDSGRVSTPDSASHAVSAEEKVSPVRSVPVGKPKVMQPADVVAAQRAELVDGGSGAGAHDTAGSASVRSAADGAQRVPNAGRYPLTSEGGLGGRLLQPAKSAASAPARVPGAITKPLTRPDSESVPGTAGVRTAADGLTADKTATVEPAAVMSSSDGALHGASAKSASEVRGSEPSTKGEVAGTGNAERASAEARQSTADTGERTSQAQAAAGGAERAAGDGRSGAVGAWPSTRSGDTGSERVSEAETGPRAAGQEHVGGGGKSAAEQRSAVAGNKSAPAAAKTDEARSSSAEAVRTEQEAKGPESATAASVGDHVRTQSAAHATSSHETGSAHEKDNAGSASAGSRDFAAQADKWRSYLAGRDAGTVRLLGFLEKSGRTKEVLSHGYANFKEKDLYGGRYLGSVGRVQAEADFHHAVLNDFKQQWREGFDEAKWSDTYERHAATADRFFANASSRHRELEHIDRDFTKAVDQVRQDDMRGRHLREEEGLPSRDDFETDRYKEATYEADNGKPRPGEDGYVPTSLSHLRADTFAKVRSVVDKAYKEFPDDPAARLNSIDRQTTELRENLPQRIALLADSSREVEHATRRLDERIDPADYEERFNEQPALDAENLARFRQEFQDDLHSSYQQARNTTDVGARASRAGEEFDHVWQQHVDRVFETLDSRIGHAEFRQFKNADLQRQLKDAFNRYEESRLRSFDQAARDRLTTELTHANEKAVDEHWYDYANNPDSRAHVQLRWDGDENRPARSYDDNRARLDSQIEARFDHELDLRIVLEGAAKAFHALGGKAVSEAPKGETLSSADALAKLTADDFGVETVRTYDAISAPFGKHNIDAWLQHEKNNENTFQNTLDSLPSPEAPAAAPHSPDSGTRPESGPGRESAPESGTEPGRETEAGAEAAPEPGTRPGAESASVPGTGQDHRLPSAEDRSVGDQLVQETVQRPAVSRATSVISRSTDRTEEEALHESASREQSASARPQDQGVDHAGSESRTTAAQTTAAETADTHADDGLVQLAAQQEEAAVRSGMSSVSDVRIKAWRKYEEASAALAYARQRADEVVRNEGLQWEVHHARQLEAFAYERQRQAARVVSRLNMAPVWDRLFDSSVRQDVEAQGRISSPGPDTELPRQQEQVQDVLHTADDGSRAATHDTLSGAASAEVRPSMTDTGERTSQAEATAREAQRVADALRSDAASARTRLDQLKSELEPKMAAARQRLDADTAAVEAAKTREAETREAGREAASKLESAKAVSRRGAAKRGRTDGLIEAQNVHDEAYAEFRAAREDRLAAELRQTASAAHLNAVRSAGPDAELAVRSVDRRVWEAELAAARADLDHTMLRQQRDNADVRLAALDRVFKAEGALREARAQEQSTAQRVVAALREDVALAQTRLDQLKSELEPQIEAARQRLDKATAAVQATKALESEAEKTDREALSKVESANAEVERVAAAKRDGTATQAEVEAARDGLAKAQKARKATQRKVYRVRADRKAAEQQQPVTEADLTALRRVVADAIWAHHTAEVKAAAAQARVSEAEASPQEHEGGGKSAADQRSGRTNVSEEDRRQAAGRKETAARIAEAERAEQEAEDTGNAAVGKAAEMLDGPSQAARNVVKAKAALYEAERQELYAQGAARVAAIRAEAARVRADGVFGERPERAAEVTAAKPWKSVLGRSSDEGLAEGVLTPERLAYYTASYAGRKLPLSDAARWGEADEWGAWAAQQYRDHGTSAVQPVIDALEARLAALREQPEARSSTSETGKRSSQAEPTVDEAQQIADTLRSEVATARATLEELRIELLPRIEEARQRLEADTAAVEAARTREAATRETVREAASTLKSAKAKSGRLAKRRRAATQAEVEAARDGLAKAQKAHDEAQAEFKAAREELQAAEQRQIAGDAHFTAERRVFADAVRALDDAQDKARAAQEHADRLAARQAAAERAQIRTDAETAQARMSQAEAATRAKLSDLEQAQAELEAVRQGMDAASADGHAGQGSKGAETAAVAARARVTQARRAVEDAEAVEADARVDLAAVDLAEAQTVLDTVLRQQRDDADAREAALDQVFKAEDALRDTQVHAAVARVGSDRRQAAVRKEAAAKIAEAERAVAREAAEKHAEATRAPGGHAYEAERQELHAQGAARVAAIRAEAARVRADGVFGERPERAAEVTAAKPWKSVLGRSSDEGLAEGVLTAERLAYYTASYAGRKLPLGDAARWGEADEWGAWAAQQYRDHGTSAVQPVIDALEARLAALRAAEELLVQARVEARWAQLRADRAAAASRNAESAARAAHQDAEAAPSGLQRVHPEEFIDPAVRERAISKRLAEAEAALQVAEQAHEEAKAKLDEKRESEATDSPEVKAAQARASETARDLSVKTATVKAATEALRQRQAEKAAFAAAQKRVAKAENALKREQEKLASAQGDLATELREKDATGARRTAALDLVHKAEDAVRAAERKLRKARGEAVPQERDTPAAHEMVMARFFTDPARAGQKGARRTQDGAESTRDGTGERRGTDAENLTAYWSRKAEQARLDASDAQREAAEAAVHADRVKAELGPKQEPLGQRTAEAAGARLDAAEQPRSETPSKPAAATSDTQAAAQAEVRGSAEAQTVSDLRSRLAEAEQTVGDMAARAEVAQILTDHLAERADLAAAGHKQPDTAVLGAQETSWHALVTGRDFDPRRDDLTAERVAYLVERYALRQRAVTEPRSNLMKGAQQAKAWGALAAKEFERGGRPVVQEVMDALTSHLLDLRQARREVLHEWAVQRQEDAARAQALRSGMSQEAAEDWADHLREASQSRDAAAMREAWADIQRATDGVAGWKDRPAAGESAPGTKDPSAVSEDTSARDSGLDTWSEPDADAESAYGDHSDAEPDTTAADRLESEPELQLQMSEDSGAASGRQAQPQVAVAERPEAESPLSASMAELLKGIDAPEKPHLAAEEAEEASAAEPTRTDATDGQENADGSDRPQTEGDTAQGGRSGDPVTGDAAVADRPAAAETAATTAPARTAESRARDAATAGQHATAESADAPAGEWTGRATPEDVARYRAELQELDRKAQEVYRTVRQAVADATPKHQPESAAGGQHTTAEAAGALAGEETVRPERRATPEDVARYQAELQQSARKAQEDASAARQAVADATVKRQAAEAELSAARWRLETEVEANLAADAVHKDAQPAGGRSATAVTSAKRPAHEPSTVTTPSETAGNEPSPAPAESSKVADPVGDLRQAQDELFRLMADWNEQRVKETAAAAHASAETVRQVEAEGGKAPETAVRQAAADELAAQAARAEADRLKKQRQAAAQAQASETRPPAPDTIQNIGFTGARFVGSQELSTSNRVSPLLPTSDRAIILGGSFSVAYNRMHLDGRWMTATEVAQYIRQQTSWDPDHRLPVVLMAGQAGRENVRAGLPSFAEQVAEDLNTPVVAPVGQPVQLGATEFVSGTPVRREADRAELRVDTGEGFALSEPGQRRESQPVPDLAAALSALGATLEPGAVPPTEPVVWSFGPEAPAGIARYTAPPTRVDAAPDADSPVGPGASAGTDAAPDTEDSVGDPLVHRVPTIGGAWIRASFPEAAWQIRGEAYTYLPDLTEYVQYRVGVNPKTGEPERQSRKRPLPWLPKSGSRPGVDAPQVHFWGSHADARSFALAQSVGKSRRVGGKETGRTLNRRASFAALPRTDILVVLGCEAGQAQELADEIGMDIVVPQGNIDVLPPLDGRDPELSLIEDAQGRETDFVWYRPRRPFAAAPEPTAGSSAPSTDDWAPATEVPRRDYQNAVALEVEDPHIVEAVPGMSLPDPGAPLATAPGVTVVLSQMDFHQGDGGVWYPGPAVEPGQPVQTAPVAKFVVDFVGVGEDQQGQRVGSAMAALAAGREMLRYTDSARTSLDMDVLLGNRREWDVTAAGRTVRVLPGAVGAPLVRLVLGAPDSVETVVQHSVLQAFGPFLELASSTALRDLLGAARGQLPVFDVPSIVGMLGGFALGAALGADEYERLRSLVVEVSTAVRNHFGSGGFEEVLGIVREAESALHDLDPGWLVPSARQTLGAGAAVATDLDRIVPQPLVESRKRLFFVPANRHPLTVWRDGLVPPGGGRSIVSHVEQGKDYRHSLFVGAFGSAVEAAGQLSRGFVFEIDAPGGIDVRATLGYELGPGAVEALFAGGSARRFVKGAWQISAGIRIEYQRWFPNPGFATELEAPVAVAGAPEAPAVEGSAAGGAAGSEMVWEPSSGGGVPGAVAQGVEHPVVVAFRPFLLELAGGRPLPVPDGGPARVLLTEVQARSLLRLLEGFAQGRPLKRVAYARLRVLVEAVARAVRAEPSRTGALSGEVREGALGVVREVESVVGLLDPAARAGAVVVEVEDPHIVEAGPLMSLPAIGVPLAEGPGVTVLLSQMDFHLGDGDVWYPGPAVEPGQPVKTAPVAKFVVDSVGVGEGEQGRSAALVALARGRAALRSTDVAKSWSGLDVLLGELRGWTVTAEGRKVSVLPSAGGAPPVQLMLGGPAGGLRLFREQLSEDKLSEDKLQEAVQRVPVVAAFVPFLELAGRAGLPDRNGGTRAPLSGARVQSFAGMLGRFALGTALSPDEYEDLRSLVVEVSTAVRDHLRSGGSEEALGIVWGAESALHDLDPGWLVPSARQTLGAGAAVATDLDRIVPQPLVESRKRLFFVPTLRHPPTVWREGLRPPGGGRSIVSHIQQGKAYRNSGFVDAFGSAGEAAKGWSSGFVFEIDAPGGIDVRATLGYELGPGAVEALFAGGSARRFVKGAWQISAGIRIEYQRWFPNPGFATELPVAGAGPVAGALEAPAVEGSVAGGDGGAVTWPYVGALSAEDREEFLGTVDKVREVLPQLDPVRAAED